MGEIIDLQNLLDMRDGWFAGGTKVVFTNGCFDLLHAGHIRYLQDARRLGDILIVGLNTDSSVRKLKGAKRPILPEAERAEILSALASVDYVVLFDDDTAERLVGLIKPDTYVKGGDYSLKSGDGAGRKALPEASIVAEYGGRVTILPLVEGRSSTDIIGTVLERYGSEK